MEAGLIHDDPVGFAQIGQLAQDDVGAPWRVFEEVLHVEHPGKHPTRRELIGHALQHHVEHVVANQLDRIKLSRQDADRAVQVQHRLAKQRHRRRHWYTVLVRQAGQLEQRGAQPQSTATHVVVATDQSANVLGETMRVETLGWHDHVQISLGHTFAQALGEGQQEQDHLVLLACIETPDHTEVHQR